MNKIRKNIIFTLLFLLPSLSISIEKVSRLNIGYQKSDPGFVLLKESGELEKKLLPLNIKVKWIEFPAGPQLLEGINTGSIDIGTTGETPPIFAQAANAKIKYFAYKSSSPQSEAIIVQRKSQISKVSELKGKKVALNKGSNVHYLLVKALEEAGLNFNDIKPIYLKPSDARAAFEQRGVDAWAIWDPFYAASELSIESKVLRNGVGLVKNYQFYVVEENYIKNQDVIKIVLEAIKKFDTVLTNEPEKTAETISKINGLDTKALTLAHKRTVFKTQYINDQVIKEQQEIADTFYELNLIPRKINIYEAIWKPKDNK